MKNFVMGFIVFPLIPIIIFFIDKFILHSMLSFYLSAFWFEFFSVGLFNGFNDYPYQKIVLLLSFIISQVVSVYWFLVCDTSRFKLGAIVDLFKIILAFSYIVLSWLGMIYLPTLFGKNPSVKELQLLSMISDPIRFTLTIYWMVFFIYMFLGFTFSYLRCYFERKS